MGLLGFRGQGLAFRALGLGFKVFNTAVAPFLKKSRC